MTLKMKPAVTVDMEQQLFAQGALTYHRTDSQNFSADALSISVVLQRAQLFPCPIQVRTSKSKDTAGGAPNDPAGSNCTGELDERPEFLQDGWNQLRNGRMDVHGAPEKGSR